MDGVAFNSPIPATEGTANYPSIFEDWPYALLNEVNDIHEYYIHCDEDLKKNSSVIEYQCQVEESSSIVCTLSPPTNRPDGDAKILTSNPEQLPFLYVENCYPKSTSRIEQFDTFDVSYEVVVSQKEMDQDQNHYSNAEQEPISYNEIDTTHYFKKLSVELGNDELLHICDDDGLTPLEEPLDSPFSLSSSNYSCITIASRQAENRVNSSTKNKRCASKTKINRPITPSKVSGKHRRNRKKAPRLTDRPEERQKIIEMYKTILRRTYDTGNKLRIHHFIIDILTNKDCHCKRLYKWEDRKELIFRIEEPDIVQTIYHHIKGNKKGDYETFGRALRHAREKNQYFEPSPTSNKKIYQLARKSVNQYRLQFGCCDLTC